MKSLILLLLLTGCASERYFTAEEDAKAKEICQQGCTIVPNPLMEQILNRLRGVAI